MSGAGAGEAWRDVDQEHRAPGRAEQVGVGEDAAENRAADRGEAHHRTDAAQGAWHLVTGEHRPDEADGLRDHQGRRRPLRGTERDQEPHARCELAGEGGSGESGDAQHEQPPPARDVAEPAPGDQQYGERQGVGGREPLDVGGRSAQFGVDRRRGHLHDRPVQQVHRLGQEQGDECGPAPGVGPLGGGRPCLGAELSPGRSVESWGRSLPARSPGSRISSIRGPHDGEVPHNEAELPTQPSVLRT